MIAILSPVLAHVGHDHGAHHLVDHVLILACIAAIAFGLWQRAARARSK